MDSESKDAEVRARVTGQMYDELEAIARGRGEQMPVVVREALAEYLARRLDAAGNYPAERTALLEAFHDRPDIIGALTELVEVLKAPTKYPPHRPSSTKVEERVRQVRARHVAKIRRARGPVPPPAPGRKPA